MRTCTLPILFAAALMCPVSAQQLRISEFLSDNASGLTDADGMTSDWLELENTSGAAVNLDGWFLTDDALVLNKWRIPAVTVLAGGRLVIFCSAKDRSNPAAELHTNFSLDAAGEYLALVQPDGLTVVSEYNPYPAQRGDISFGVARVTTDDRVVTPESAAKWHVPTSGTLGLSWNENGFADGSWTSVSAAVGFQQSTGGPAPQAYWTFDDTNLDVIAGLATSINGAAYSTAVPSQLGAGKSLAFSSVDNDYTTALIDVSETAYTASFWFRTTNANAGLLSIADGDLGNGGHDRHLFLSAGNIRARTWNNETISSTGKAYANGAWHHVAHVYGGTEGGQKIYVDGILVATGAKAFSDFNWQKRLHLGFSNDAASQYLNGEIDDVGVFAASLTAAQVAVLASGSTPLALSGVTPYVRSNVSASLYNVNSSGYLRVPFTLPRPAADYEEVLAKVRYDDGFILYLNGTEVARRNAPAGETWNSAALADRALSAAITVEEIDLTAFKSLLTVGTNVLAVHALNSLTNSVDFLFSPELICRDVEENGSRYMATPTPGLANAGGFLDFVADTKFSIDRGWFTAPFATTISCDTQGSTMVYTTNGSEPTLTNGTQVTSGAAAIPSVTLNISSTTLLRAAAFKAGWQPTRTDTQTYIFTNQVRSQPAAPPGVPTTWAGSFAADYAVDPNVTNTTLAGYGFEDALLSLPTLSIVGAPGDIFGAPSGIYYDTSQRGLASEKRISVEFFDPNGGPERWQANAGIRSHGNSSRGHTFTPKHPFRLYFRRDYGDAKLKEKVFPDSPIEEFNRLNLRAASTDSWPVVDGPPRWVNEKGTYLRDAHMRKAFRDLGNLSGHTRYVQMFFNGLYWGIYEITERPEEDFAASYLGGDSNEYDVLKDFAELASGNTTAWTALMALANPSPSTLSTDAGYWQVQGRNPDGTVNPAIEPLLHMSSFIDYMILHIAGGAEDWPNHNWWVARRRGPLSDGFHFFAWDQEISYDNTSRTGSVIFPNTFELVNAANCPAILYDRLRLGPKFKQRFRERVHELYYNGGLCTPANSRARWAGLQAQIDKAMVGESARWGDSKQTPAFKRETTWLAEMNFMQAPTTGFWDYMWPVQIQRFRNAGLYPSIDQPTMSRAGGVTAPGSALYLDSPVGTIYYTTDGTDPMGSDGNPSPTAQVFINGSSTSDLIAKNSVWKYLVTGVSQGTTWRNLSYNDSAWPTGAGQLGYGDNDEGTVIGYGGNPSSRYMTTYFRKSFTVADPASITALKVKLLRDDGAVVFLNGTEVMRSNLHPTNTITYTTAAQTNVGGVDETSFYYEQSISPSLLVSGNNVISVEVHKVSTSEDDLSFDLALAATQLTGTQPIILNTTETVTARVLNGTEWSGKNSALYYVDSAPASAANLVISEIHYHPLTPQRNSEISVAFDKDQYEFIELTNISAAVVDLTGVAFTEGITFSFDAGSIHELAPGGRLLVARNAAALAARYGAGLPVAGVFAADTGLANNGEAISLTGPGGTVIRSFTYDDTPGLWPTSPDGSGPSLELVNPSSNPDHALPTNWRASFDLGGTPGTTADTLTYSQWRYRFFDPGEPNFAAVSDPLADADGDGFSNLTEFALASQPVVKDQTPALTNAWQAAPGGSYLTITYIRRPASTVVSIVVEQSGDLAAWNAAPFTLLSSTLNADGSVTETVRLENSLSAGRSFYRLKVEATSP